MGDGPISCSYNYSNFDDEPGGGGSLANRSVTEGPNRGGGGGEGGAGGGGEGGGGAAPPRSEAGGGDGGGGGGGAEEGKKLSLGAQLEQKESDLISFYEGLVGGLKQKKYVESDALPGCVMSSEPDDEFDTPGSSRAAGVGSRWRRRTASASMLSRMPEEFTQEGGIALWVKWRGKWRACIQCYPSDFSIATARAMPTYSKKTYVVVFFPNSRTYSWVDLEFACHITENPEPLAFGTHQSGREAVENLDLPKQHMLRVLAASMLDISERLPVKAVVPNAQDVDAWKDFANELVEARDYSDVSKMLIKLFARIELSCYNDSWLREGFQTWKNDCESADSAQTVENLNKELLDAINWDFVSSHWDEEKRSAVGAEWRDWKRALIENRTVYSSVSATPEASLFLDPEKLRKRRMADADVDMAIKRSRLEVHRRYPTHLFPSGGKRENSQAEASGLSGEQDEYRARSSSSEPVDNLSGRSSSLVHQNSLTVYQPPRSSEGGLFMTPTVCKRLASNYQLCAAYMESKKRQCTRFPSQGSLYCCKHMSLAGRDGAMEGVKRLVDVNTPRAASAPPKVSSAVLPRLAGDRICEGITKYGRRCTHRSKVNSLFCRKHTFADAPHIDPATGLRRPDAPEWDPETGLPIMEGDKVGESSEMEKSKAEAQEPAQAAAAAAATLPSDRMKNFNWHARHIGKMIKINANAAVRIRCLGTCVTGEQCLHKSRPGSDFCEKHQPEDSSKEEPVVENRKQDEAQAFLKAKTWLSRYMEIAKADGAGSSESVESLLDWVIDEASKDLSAADILMKLVSQRKEKLERFFKLQERAEASNVEKQLAMEGAEENDEKGGSQELAGRMESKLPEVEKIKCSICDNEFVEMVELGEHWKSAHPTEANWFVKGYACKECKKEFTNKSSLERHCKSDHDAADAARLSVTVCINCEEQFPDFEALWSHTVTGHPDHLSAMPTIALPEDEEAMEEDEVVDEEGEEEERKLIEKNFLVAIVEREKPDEKSAKNEDEEFPEVPSSEEELFQEMDVAGYVDSKVISDSDNGDDERKFKCKVCGKKFTSLPDLGRHHQMDHMSDHVGTISKARTGGMVPGARRNRKRIRVSKQGLSSIRKIRRALHSVKQQKSEKVEAPAKLPWPPAEEVILSSATSACCEVRMLVELEAKYEQAPREMVRASVVKVAAERNVEIKWAAEGFVCAQGCAKRTLDTRLVARKNSAPPPVRKKFVVVCEDISFGKEHTPVPCVEDEEPEACSCPQCREGKTSSSGDSSSKPWERFNYVTRRLLDPSLGVDTKDSQVGCSCGRGRCSAKSCDHVDMFDSDYTDACDIWGDEMTGRFPYDTQGRIILQEGYLVYECNTSCLCAADCPNRVLQKGVRVKLEVFKTKHKGWAVRAAQHIPRGTFVCEYLGEVLNDQEASRRGERYDQVGCSYLYDIDAHLNKGRSRRGARLPRLKPFVIDASKHGNVSRFINHSCSPNLVNYQVLVESMDYQLAHIGLYASRDIMCGEELAYDYRYRLLPGKGCPCHCGSSGCRGRLY